MGLNVTFFVFFYGAIVESPVPSFLVGGKV